MATGVPVVTTYIDGTREIVREGLTCFVVHPHEAEKKAERILRLLNNADEGVLILVEILYAIS